MCGRSERGRREDGGVRRSDRGLLGARQLIRNNGLKAPRHLISGGIQIPPGAAKPATAILGRFLEAIGREQRGLGLNQRLRSRWLAAQALRTAGARGRLGAGWRAAGSDRGVPVGSVAAPGPSGQVRSGQVLTNGAGELRVCSVAPEPARRLDAVQFGKIKGADRLQLVCERRLQEIVGQVVEPPALAGAFVADGGAPPVAFDVEFEDGGPVHEPVDGSDGHGRVGEDLVPLAERLVGGEQQGALLVTCADQLEQDAGLGLILGDVGKIVEHDEVKLVELPDGGLECQLAARGLHL